MTYSFSPRLKPIPSKIKSEFSWFNSVNSIDQKNLVQLFICEENLTTVVTFDGTMLTAKESGVIDK